MDSDGLPDYKALFLREAELRREAEEREQREVDLRRQAEERRQREVDLRRQAEEEARRITQKTHFFEFLQACHRLFSLPLQVQTPSRSTKGNIPAPEGKYCPTELRPWEDCPAIQQEMYSSVCTYLQANSDSAPRLFTSLSHLEGVAGSLQRALGSEQDLERYEGPAVENHVRAIIVELCKNPEARQRFQLGDGIWFDNHANSLDDDTVADDASMGDHQDQSATQRPRPDQFCVHKVDDRNTLLTTVEYKPPHKLSVENLCAGLRQMNFWDSVVQKNIIPLELNEKLKHNAEQLSGSVLTQEYHVMICEGLEYSYVTNGLALVLLWVPYDDPSTLHYYLCQPNVDVDLNDDQNLQQPKTTIARVLCLCLMSSLSFTRNHAWRDNAKAQLHTWVTSFARVHSKIPASELEKTPPDSRYTGSECGSAGEPDSEWLPSSSSEGSPTPVGRRQSRPGCAPSHEAYPRTEEDSSSDSDHNKAATGRKRKRNEYTSSPSNQHTSRPRSTRHDQGFQHRQHTAQYCTQRCLLGLQQGGALDGDCPNVSLHRQHGNSGLHSVTAEGLTRLLKQQLDEDFDHNCTPFGACGGYGAPFKITSSQYGYTVLGKGTTTKLWTEVSREADIYRVLRKAQGSAVPVFLGTVDLAKTYLLHGAGEIRHMLIIGWGGERINTPEQQTALFPEIRRSRQEMHSFGVMHGDFRIENMLWNSEVGRVMIIDFHCAKLAPRLKQRQIKRKREPLGTSGEQGPRRIRVGLSMING